MMNTNAVWRNGYYPHSIPCEALLYPDEIAYLHWVGSQKCTRDRTIIDLGAFLGGSSYALASGSSIHGEHSPQIHAYDAFQVTKSQTVTKLVPGQVGDSYLEQYCANLHAFLHRLTTHVGFIPPRITDEKTINDLYSDDREVGVLFIDCAKEWGVHHTIWNVFGSRLVPGSIVVQQDFRTILLYIAIHMYQLRESIIPVHFVEGGTVGFEVQSKVAQSMIDQLWTREQVIEQGYLKVVDRIAQWFDAVGSELLSPWIWLSAAADCVLHGDQEFIEVCIQRAKAGLGELARSCDNPTQRETWNGEVNRLSTYIKKHGFSELFPQVKQSLHWKTDADMSRLPSQIDDRDVIWNRIEQSCLDLGCTSILLFGAGRHTSRLLASNWPKGPTLRVVGIVDDCDGKVGYHIAGIPIVSREQVSLLEADIILPSTDVYEDQVMDSCISIADANEGMQTMRVYSVSKHCKDVSC